MNNEQLSQLVQDVIDGNENPLKAYAILKKRQDYIKICLDEIMDEVISVASKYEEKNFSTCGYNFELRSGATRYDFKSIHEWVEKNNELKEIEKKYKAAYQNYKSGQLSVTKDGEELKLPKVTNNKDSLIVK